VLFRSYYYYYYYWFFFFYYTSTTTATAATTTTLLLLLRHCYQYVVLQQWSSSNHSRASSGTSSSSSTSASRSGSGASSVNSVAATVASGPHLAALVPLYPRRPVLGRDREPLGHLAPQGMVFLFRSAIPIVIVLVISLVSCGVAPAHAASFSLISCGLAPAHAARSLVADLLPVGERVVVSMGRGRGGSIFLDCRRPSRRSLSP